MPETISIVATSYPRSDTDWQGLFIKRLTDATASSRRVSLWAPPGPLAEGVSVNTTLEDQAFLLSLANRGGIAHSLRSRPLVGLGNSLQLLRRLRRFYRRNTADVLHINWLQNALPLRGLGRKAVITILGTDYQLLKLPGMVGAVRSVLATNRCALAPNAPWMTETLHRLFGDLAPVETVNFGIDGAWFKVRADQVPALGQWLCVTRLTEKKIGDLFTWGEAAFASEGALDLIGPNQASLTVPNWVKHHGHADPATLAGKWFPRAQGLISLSRHAEGRPQVMLEAMAAGLPIIASDLPAHRSTIEPLRTGYLVQSQGELVDAVKALKSTTARREMGVAARELAIQEFGTWQDCANRYDRLYRSL